MHGLLRSRSPGARPPGLWLPVLLSLFVAPVALAQVDVGIVRMEAQTPGADLSLPAERGEIVIDAIFAFDPRGNRPERATVEGFLVATRNGETERLRFLQEEIDGRRLWPAESDEPAERMRFRRSIDGPVLDFLLGRFESDISVEVRITQSEDPEEPEAGLPNEAGHALRPIRLLSGALRFGAMQGTITVRPVTDPTCGPGEVRIFSDDGRILLSTRPGWETIALPQDVCARLVLDGAGLIAVVEVFNDADLVLEGTPQGLKTLVLGTLTPAGFAARAIAVHGLGLTFHADDADTPRQIGTPMLAMGAAPEPVGDLTDLRGSTSRAVWVRPPALPFLLRADSIELGADGIVGRWNRARPNDTVPFAPRDARSNSQHLPTNTFRFRRPAGAQPDRSLRIDADGLHARVAFNPVRGQTHFPGMAASSGPLDVQIEASRLVPTRSPEAESWQFGQRASCPACSAADDQAVWYAPLAESIGISADGAVFAAVERLPDGPVFGPTAQDGSERPIFERLDDGERGVVLIPGFEALGTAHADGDVAAYLMASRAVNPEQGLPGAIHANDAAARRGDHFFPGVNLGPARLAADGPGAGVDLSRTRMRIGFGGAAEPDWRTIINSAPTKYVVRRGGLTGTFNTAAPPQPQLYGYPTRLDRFAFRVVSNALDDRTWMDGRISVPGRGGFAIDFEDMDLRCTGQVDRGRLAGRDCEAGINCDQRLSAWRAPFDIGAIRFDPVEGGICSPAPRQLYTDAEVAVHALRDPVAMGSSWTPAGDPVAVAINSGASNQIDGPTGFDVLLHGEVGLESPANRPDEGWFIFRSTTPVPFWDALPLLIRAENGPDDQARPSAIIADPGAVPAAFAEQSYADLVDDLANEAGWRPQAKYRWGQ